MDQKKYNRLVIYPSYSLRDYRKNVYLLDGDAEFNQMISEAKVLEKYFENIVLIIPEQDQRKLDYSNVPDGITTVIKRYQVNVGAERFSHDVEYFRKMNIQENDVLYSNFLSKTPLSPQ